MKNRNKVLLLGTAGCFALSLTSVAVAAAVDAEPEFVTAADVAVIDPSDDSTTRYIVKYKDGTTSTIQSGAQAVSAFSEQKAETFARNYKGKVIRHLSSVKSSVLELNPRQVKAMVSDPEVQFIEVDHKRYLFDVITPMAQSGVETILGVQNDPTFGPMILYGAGGTAVELYRDVALASARGLPVSAMPPSSTVTARLAIGTTA